MHQSSVSISLSFENQGINPVGDYTQIPSTYANNQEPCNQRDKGVVNPLSRWLRGVICFVQVLGHARATSY